MRCHECGCRETDVMQLRQCTACRAEWVGTGSTRLTDEEVEALRYVRPGLEHDSNTKEWRAFLAVLDKLIARGGGGQ